MSKELVFGVGGHPIKKNDFEHLQSSHKEFMESISKFISSDGTFKAYGCVVEETPTMITWSEGSIFYNGIYYKVDSGNLLKQVSPTIPFNPFWKIITNILSPSPTNYETGIQYNVHIEKKMILVEEPQPSDIGIYESIIPQISNPLLQNLNNIGSPGVNVEVLFNISGSLGIISVNSNVISNNNTVSILSGTEIEIIFSRTIDSNNCRYKVGSGDWNSIWFNSGIQSNSITKTITININTTITIQWLPSTTLYNFNRIGSFTSNAPVYVTNQEAVRIINSNNTLFDGDQDRLQLGEHNISAEFYLLKSISIDYYPYNDNFNKYPDYFVFGTPIISSFKINNVEYKQNLSPGVLVTKQAELDRFGEEDFVFLTGVGNITHYKYYEYKYLKYTIILPNTPIADVTNVQWSYVRDTDDNGYELPDTPIGGSGCLQINTLITMFDGTKKELRDVKVGDKLLSIVLENNEIKTEATEVLDKKYYADNHSRIIQDRLHMTLQHNQPIIRNNEVMNVKGKDIRRGDILISNFENLKINKILDFEGSEMFCNIVTGNGYYIANDIVTHNKTALPIDPILG